jgi:hypothetical protein
METSPELLTISEFSLKASLHRGQKTFRFRIHPPRRFDHAHEREEPGIAVLVFGLAVREAGQAAKMSPVRTSAIPTKFISQSACGGRTEFFAQRVRVLQPGLKVQGTRFH